MTILTIDEIQQKIVPIAKKYNLKSVYLFGSYARGEAREDSDIDLLYVKKDNTMSLLTKMKLLYELEDSLHKEVDLVSLYAFDLNQTLPNINYLKESIISDRKEIYVA